MIKVRYPTKNTQIKATQAVIKIKYPKNQHIVNFSFQTSSLINHVSFSLECPSFFFFFVMIQVSGFCSTNRGGERSSLLVRPPNKFESAANYLHPGPDVPSWLPEEIEP